MFVNQWPSEVVLCGNPRYRVGCMSRASTSTLIILNSSGFTRDRPRTNWFKCAYVDGHRCSEQTRYFFSFFKFEMFLLKLFRHLYRFSDDLHDFDLWFVFQTKKRHFERIWKSWKLLLDLLHTLLLSPM